MPEILKRFPDAHIYTTGRNLMHLSTKQKLLISSYQLYLLELIKKYSLEDHITFLGSLSEQEMCRQYLNANVFVSPSTIENSPNSVGEAMLVGCPVVTSDVGGVKNMLEHGKEGFIYQCSAPYMLAYYVNRIFEDDALAMTFSKNGKTHAARTHNREANMKTLYEIYNQIISKQSLENRGGITDI
jgi:glycosyltransferase involved in cell wall biosynthesis